MYIVLQVEDSAYLTSRVHGAASSMVNGGRTEEEALNQYVNYELWRANASKSPYKISTRLSVSPHCGFSPRCVPSGKGDEVGFI